MIVIMSHVKEEERSSRQRELEREAEEHKRLMAREEHAEQLRFLIIIVDMISTNIIRLERERAEQRRAQENADHESKLVSCRLFLKAIFVLGKYQRSNIFALYKYLLTNIFVLYKYQRSCCPGAKKG